MSVQALTNFTPEQLQGFRASYSYPKAYMRIAKKGEAGDVQLFEGGPMAIFCRPAESEVTDLCLDRYHQGLLCPKKPEQPGQPDQQTQVVLGLASVIYWGFYTFGHNFAVNRVNWFLQGRPPHGNPVCPNEAVRCLQTARSHAKTGHMGQAISALSGLNQLSRTPFASKVIAFLDPDKAGVYDNRIRNGLHQDPYPLSIRNGVGSVRTVRYQQRYQAWCEYLQQVAGLLNEGKEDRTWSCAGDIEECWRPLDVERALFAAFQSA